MSLDQALNGAADWTEPGPLTPITQEEHDRLVGLEEVIEAGLVSFVAVGTALAEVRDGRLYRESHATFEGYCQARWHFTGRRAYQLMEAADVCTTVQAEGAPPLANEAQARALAAAPAEERADVMAAVAEKGKPTAAAITDEIEARHPKPPAPSPAPPTVETGRVPSTAPPASPSPPAQAEPEFDVCVGCGEVDPPGFAGSHCPECWEKKGQADPIRIEVEISAAAPKPPTLRDRPEVKEVDRVWAPAKALGKGLRSMLPALEVMEVLPADSLESFDDLADEAIAWGKRWKEERKSAGRLRLMGVKGIRR